MLISVFYYMFHSWKKRPLHHLYSQFLPQNYGPIRPKKFIEYFLKFFSVEIIVIFHIFASIEEGTQTI